MGDRANAVLVFEDDTELYLYTHWGGDDLPEDLREALIFAKSRWDDEPYLARILISQLFKHEHGDTTGAGISPYVTDGDDRLIFVDLPDNVVQFGSRDNEAIPFADYVAQDEASW